MGEIIGVVSGKGGVGKTTVTACLGAALSHAGHRVLLCDGDFGLRDLDLVLGVADEIIYDALDASEDKEYTDADISPEERLELEQKEQLLMEEAQGIYPEWNEMTDISLIEAMFSLQEEERKLIYQHVFEERTFKEMSILNQMTEERCKGAYYWAIRKIRKRMGGKKS